jgi:hypothetical protein
MEQQANLLQEVIAKRQKKFEKYEKELKKEIKEKNAHSI